MSPLVPLKVLNGIVSDFCFDKYGTLYALRENTKLVVIKVNGDSNTIEIPFTFSIIPDYSGTGIYLLCYQNYSYQIYYQTEWNSFVDSPLYTYGLGGGIGICSDRDDNLHVLTTTLTNYEVHKLVNGNMTVTIINNLSVSTNDGSITTQKYINLVGSLSDGSIIINYDGFLYIVVEEAENTDAVSIDSSVKIKDSVIDSNDVIYSTGYSNIEYNGLCIYKFTKTGNSWNTEVVHNTGTWYIPTLCIDKHDKVYATDRLGSIYLVDNWIPIWYNSDGAYGIDKMKIDPIYGEIHFLTPSYFNKNKKKRGGDLYVLEDPRALSFKEFNLPSDKVFSLNIDQISQTEFFLGINYDDESFNLSGDIATHYSKNANPLITYELTYKPNDPLIVDQEIKIISAFNAYDTMNRFNEYQTWVENLQPDVSYIVSLRISTSDPAFYTYVSDELEIQTLAYNSPVVNMSININKDILLSLSTDPADDPLPPDASYYIAYFQGTIPKQLIFHRVNGSLYILPDKSLLDTNKQLEVLAFIRYGYEMDDNDLIDDLRESVGTDKTITLDNGPVRISNYSRRGVLTDDSFFLNL
jgi:hypothetical protein